MNKLLALTIIGIVLGASVIGTLILSNRQEMSTIETKETLTETPTEVVETPKETEVEQKNPDTMKTNVDVSMFDFPESGKDVYEDLQKIGCELFKGDHLLPLENAIRIPSYKAFLYLAHGNIVILSQKVWRTGSSFREGKQYICASDCINCLVITDYQTLLWEYIWTEELLPEEVDEWIEGRKIQW